jgi:hypothetical protein
VRELVEPLGLAWLEPFGLDGGFAIAVRREIAISSDIATISDLAALPGALPFAADAGYLARPVDGLFALARRYGLRIGRIEVLPVGDRNQLYDALVDQRVDVAEVFMTDARLDDYGVLALTDGLNFFWIYRPAPLVRQDALKRFPKLAGAWDQLAGRISTDDMRRLNGRVERQGEDYRNVVRRHLEALDLLPEEPAASEPRGSVALAVTPLSDLGYLPIRAADAIHEVMPTRRLKASQHDLPAAAVRDGSARFGMLGAEDFYQIGPNGELIQARDIEAVGSRPAHVIASADDTDPRAWERVATGVEGGSS